MSKIILALSGTVASTLTLKMYHELVAIGHEVRVVVTDRAKAFMDCNRSNNFRNYLWRTKDVSLPWDKEIVCPIYDDQTEWFGNMDKKYENGAPVVHVELADWADAVVLFASMNTISDIAYGKTDCLLTSLIGCWENYGQCSTDVAIDFRKRDRYSLKPIIVCPAMHTRMLLNPATKENLSKIRYMFNATIVATQVKKLACGIEGDGALAKIPDILDSLSKSLAFLEERRLTR